MLRRLALEEPETPEPMELEEPPSEFVRQLRAAMVEKGWKSEKLGAHLRVNPRTVRFWLSGETQCSNEAEMLRRLALEEPETPEQLEWNRLVDDAELQGIAGGREILRIFGELCQRCGLPVGVVSTTLRRHGSKLSAASVPPRLCGPATRLSSLSYVAFLLSDVAYEQYKEGVLTAAAIRTPGFSSKQTLTTWLGLAGVWVGDGQFGPWSRLTTWRLAVVSNYYGLLQRLRDGVWPARRAGKSYVYLMQFLLRIMYMWNIYM